MSSKGGFRPQRRSYAEQLNTTPVDFYLRWILTADVFGF